MWRVSLSFLKQGVLKEALTEGEFYLMNLFPLIPLPDQGVYQVSGILSHPQYYGKNVTKNQLD